MSGRILKINSEIEKALSEIISYELRNPKITGIISVTKVDTTNDLDFAKVYVSIFDKANQEDIFNEIKHSAGFIRKELCSRVQLRKVPYLNFYLDNTYEIANSIDEKIKQIQDERKEQ